MPIAPVTASPVPSSAGMLLSATRVPAMPNTGASSAAWASTRTPVSASARRAALWRAWALIRASSERVWNSASVASASSRSSSLRGVARSSPSERISRTCGASSALPSSALYCGPQARAIARAMVAISRVPLRSTVARIVPPNTISAAVPSSRVSAIVRGILPLPL